MRTSPLDKLRAFWNQRYAEEEFAYGIEPNDFLVRISRRLATRGPVLCLADSEGRNDVWVARRGIAVTSIDIAQHGLDKEMRVAAVQGCCLRGAD